MVGVVDDGDGHRRQALGHGAGLHGIPPGAGLRQRAAQFGEGAWAVLLAPDQLGRSGIQRAHLCGGESRQHGEAARGELGGQAHPDVGDQSRTPGGALLDDVEDVPAVHDREVRIVRRRIDQSGEQRRGDPLQRRLPPIGGAQLVGRGTQPEPARLAQVADKAAVREGHEDAVGARPGQAQVAGDRGGRQRLGMPCQQLQHVEGVRDGRVRIHAVRLSRLDQGVSYLGHDLVSASPRRRHRTL